MPKSNESQAQITHLLTAPEPARGTNIPWRPNTQWDDIKVTMQSFAWLQKFIEKQNKWGEKSKESDAAG